MCNEDVYRLIVSLCFRDQGFRIYFREVSSLFQSSDDPAVLESSGNDDMCISLFYFKPFPGEKKERKKEILETHQMKKVSVALMA